MKAYLFSIRYNNFKFLTLGFQGTTSLWGIYINDIFYPFYNGISSGSDYAAMNQYDWISQEFIR